MKKLSNSDAFIAIIILIVMLGVSIIILKTCESADSRVKPLFLDNYTEKQNDDY